jgi:hypothetical protein
MRCNSFDAGGEDKEDTVRAELNHTGGDCFDLLLIAEQDDALFDFSEPLTFEGIEAIVRERKGDVDVVIEGWSLAGPGDPRLSGKVRGAVVVEVSITRDNAEDAHLEPDYEDRFYFDE